MFAFSPLSRQTKIYLISDCWGPHECGASPDHPLVRFLCVASGWVAAVCCCVAAPLHVIQDGIFCFASCRRCCRRRGECGELLLRLSGLEFMQTQHDHQSKHTLMQGHTLHTNTHTHRHKHTRTVSSLCPNLGA